MLRPLLMPVPLAAGAFAAGGVPGFLLGFLAVLVALDRLLDRVIDVTGATRVEAERRFLRLARERRRAGADHLVYLAMDAGQAAVAARRPLGLQAITIQSIVGTVDAHKAVTFDRDFRPPSWSRGRWTLMYLAARRGTQLPPIAVYRIGDEHYIRDGHHRVSVARALRAADIDAHVIELLPRHRSP